MKIIQLNIIFLLLPWISGLSARQLNVEARLDTNTILIGDQTHYILKVEKPKDLKIIWPLEDDTITGNIEILSHGDIDTVSQNGDKITIERKYLITSFDSGYFAIPPQRIIYNYRNDSTFDYVESRPLLLTVNTVPVDTTKAFKDIKEVMNEPYTFGEIMMIYILPLMAIILVALLIIFLVKKLRKGEPVFKKVSKPLPPPDIEAIKALDKLKEKQLWQNNMVKEYFSELTDIIRRYIERRFDFPAQEMTTAEIIGSLKSLNIDEKLIAATEDVLSVADLVKFAKYTTLGDENSNALKWAYDFVEKTKTAEEQTEKEGEK